MSMKWTSCLSKEKNLLWAVTELESPESVAERLIVFPSFIKGTPVPNHFLYFYLYLQLTEVLGGLITAVNASVWKEMILYKY